MKAITEICWRQRTRSDAFARKSPAAGPGAKTRGFTIIELLTALVLIALLATIALPKAYRARSAAYIAVMESDLKTLAIAQENFYASAGGYFLDDPTSSGPTYAKNKKKLAFTPSPGVKVKIRGTPSGWSGRAEHKRRSPDKYYCAVYIGNVTPFAPAVQEGLISCEPRKRKKKKK